MSKRIYEMGGDLAPMDWAMGGDLAPANVRRMGGDL